MNQSTSSQPFEKLQQVRFKHCDPAGIVFYPRYFEMLNDLVEDWCAEALELDFHEMHTVRRLGIPTVTVDCRFVAPSRLGDWLIRSLIVTQLGRSSVALRVRFTGRDDQVLRLEADHKIAFVNLDTMRPLAIPDDVRARIEPFIAAQAPAPLPTAQKA